MSQVSANNKRIAKNTLLLYFRMLFLMTVNLYTSRVILNALGVEDFGIYNVVGGVVTMFSVMSGALSTSISRFITYELGKNNESELNKIFSVSVTIQLLISIIIVISIESVGIWFLNTHMTIPQERIYAANWVLQFSIVTFVINLISVPYNAAIIAHERMSAFSYISILEALGKLAIAFFIIISPIDKLIFYSVLMCTVAIIIRLVYGNYCKKHFKECTYHFYWDKELLKKMFCFGGWNFIGSSAGVLRTQGINILLNLYFDPIVNAARGISVQVNNAINSFSTNFLTAINPQIIKSYSQQDFKRSYQLVMYGARFSFLLLSILSIPIIFETDFILQLWLKNVPDYSTNFVRLTLILTIIESLSLPLVTLQQATGQIRNYQIIVGTLHLLNFPFSLILLHTGFYPEIVYFVAIILAIISLYARLYMQKRQFNIPLILFHKEVLTRISLTTIASTIILSVIKKYNPTPLCGILLSFLTVLFFTMIIGLKKQETGYILTKIKKKK